MFNLLISVVVVVLFLGVTVPLAALPLNWPHSAYGPGVVVGPNLEVGPVLTRLMPGAPFMRICSPPVNCSKWKWELEDVDALLQRQNVLAAISRQIKFVYIPKSNGKFSLGTAFMFNSTMGYTAAHVTEQCSSSLKVQGLTVSQHTHCRLFNSRLQQLQDPNSGREMNALPKLDLSIANNKPAKHSGVTIDIAEHSTRILVGEYSNYAFFSLNSFFTIANGHSEHAFRPTLHRPEVGDTVIAFGYPGLRSGAAEGGRDGKSHGALPSDLLNLVFGGCFDLSLSIGKVHFVSEHIIVHSASALQGQSGGPVILLKDLLAFDFTNPHSVIRFVGINSESTHLGLMVATVAHNPQFQADYARYVLDL